MSEKLNEQKIDNSKSKLKDNDKTISMLLFLICTLVFIAFAIKVVSQTSITHVLPGASSGTDIPEQGFCNQEDERDKVEHYFDGFYNKGNCKLCEYYKVIFL